MLAQKPVLTEDRKKNGDTHRGGGPRGSLLQRRVHCLTGVAHLVVVGAGPELEFARRRRGDDLVLVVLDRAVLGGRDDRAWTITTCLSFVSSHIVEVPPVPTWPRVEDGVFAIPHNLGGRLGVLHLANQLDLDVLADLEPRPGRVVQNLYSQRRH